MNEFLNCYIWLRRWSDWTNDPDNPDRRSAWNEFLNWVESLDAAEQALWRR